MSGVAARSMGNLTQIFGSKGTITLSNDDEKLWLARRHRALREHHRERSERRPARCERRHLERLGRGPDAELAAAIREQRPPRRGATFVDGLANQQVLDAVRLSGANAAGSGREASMPALDRQSVVVTGAAQGLGAAIARHLHAGGARLILMDRDRAGLGGRSRCAVQARSPPSWTWRTRPTPPVRLPRPSPARSTR